jgi:hypothetical protein
MGEWSDYFEDFPEENPANDGVLNPLAAIIQQLVKRHALAQYKAQAEINTMIAKAKQETKARSLLVVEDCPQCGLKELNT